MTLTHTKSLTDAEVIALAASVRAGKKLTSKLAARVFLTVKVNENVALNADIETLLDAVEAIA
jgi:hypothetical protein